MPSASDLYKLTAVTLFAAMAYGREIALLPGNLLVSVMLILSVGFKGPRNEHGSLLADAIKSAELVLLNI